MNFSEKLRLLNLFLSLLALLAMIVAALIVRRAMRRTSLIASQQQDFSQKYDRLSDCYVALAQAINANRAWAHPEGNPDWISEQAPVTGATSNLGHVFTQYAYAAAIGRPSLPTFKEKAVLQAVDEFVTAVEKGGEKVGYPAKELADILIEEGFVPVLPGSIPPEAELDADSFYLHHMGSLVYALQNGTPVPSAGAHMKYIQARVMGSVSV